MEDKSPSEEEVTAEDRQRDALLLPLKMEEGVTGQGMWTRQISQPLEFRRDKEMDSPQNLQKEGSLRAWCPS